MTEGPGQAAGAGSGRGTRDLEEPVAALDRVEEIAQVGSYEWALDGSPPVWSRQLYRLLGYQPGEVPPTIEAFERKVHPDDRAGVMVKLGGDVVAGVQAHMDYRLRNRTGEVRWVRANGRFDCDAAGKPVRMVGTLMDITERVLAEQSLRTANATLSAAQALADIGSWTFEFATGRLSWSDQLWRVHGFEPGAFQLDAERGKRLVHPDDQEALVRMHSQVGDGRSTPITYRVVRPSGEIREVLAHATLVRDDTGMPVRLLGAVLDITERRRLEDLLAQSQRMEAIGRLAGGVAHDFNNLLATIVLNASMGRRQVAGNPKAEIALDEIEAAASRAGELTKQLLAFARRQPIAPRVFAPGEVTRSLVALLERLVSRPITLRVVTASDLWRVKADPTQFEQVLVNLVVNARDAMPDGGAIALSLHNVTLDEDYASRHPDARPGEHVVLEVSDPGLGMSEEILRHVFEPFFTTKRPGEGTGLGLATVYGIVCQAGGHVTVESTPGSGSTFRVYLPRTGEDLAEPTSARPTVGSLGRELILLVEDDEQLRRATSKVLEGLGYAVLTASGAPDALAFVDAMPSQLSILVTDVVMQGMGGIELAREVVRRRPGARVLLISGYSPPEVGVTSSLVEPNAFPLLPKPFSPAQLAQRIREILDAPPMV